jgi:nucleoside phosphorylase
VYAPPPALRAVVAAKRIALVEPVAIESRGAIPDPMPVSCEADASLSDSLIAVGAIAADVANTVAITTDDALAARIASSSRCAVEHLEAFAVARACAQRGVPFAAALGIANVVGANAREEWRANHQAAGDAAVAVLLRWLDADR